MAIDFTISRRGMLPGEVGEVKDVKNLYPRLRSRETTDAVEFQRKGAWGTVMSADTLEYALGEVRRILLHEMRDGKSVRLPGIGTFRLGLKGSVEERDGSYHGRDVHVSDLQFLPDRRLMRELAALPVNQDPHGQAVDTSVDRAEEVLTDLFSRNETITHRNVYYAFMGELTHHRVVSLLTGLVAEGRLLREGERSQTRYRAAQGHFGR